MWIFKKCFSFLFFLMIFSFLIIGCGKEGRRNERKIKKENCKGEYIYRKHDQFLYSIPTPTSLPAPSYPWDEDSSFRRITKEYFRCRGSTSHPPIEDANQTMPLIDCGGIQSHSLPLIHGKEGVYPILIDLLNYVQKKTQKRVVITCGHRCPAHNAYADASKKNRVSKHLIGAEVDFYVKGLEDEPEKIVELLIDFYNESSKYRGKEEFVKFLRYDKEDLNVTTPAWYNKEIFIKIFQANEGRDFDNRHPYPYVSIQVKYDRDTQKRVVYTWDLATKGFLRE